MARTKKNALEKELDTIVNENAKAMETAETGEVPEIQDTLEESYVVEDKEEMPNPVGVATSEAGTNLVGERPEPKKPEILVPDEEAAPENTEEESAAEPEPQAAEAQPEPAPEAKPETEGPKQKTADEILAEQRAMAKAAMSAPTYTAEKIAQEQGTADLAENQPDLVQTAMMDAQDQERKSFADLLQSMRDDYNKAQAESDEQVKEDLNAAKWTGLTELAASLANLIGVGQGNAVSQQYKSHAQDWMQKADQDMRERRSRLDNLRQRQRDTELKMSQLKASRSLELAKFEMQREQARLQNQYQMARIAYENARTDAARKKAEQDAREAEQKLKYIQSQVNAQEALVRQRNASASASMMNAATRRLGQENQNANRDITSAARASADNALAYQRLNKANGVVQPNPALQHGQPASVPASQVQSGKNTGLGDYK